MITTFINFLIKEVALALGVALALLPDTPFEWTAPEGMAEFLGTINYFIPFATMVTIMISYVTAVGLWYVVRWVLRFVRYIQ